MTRILLTRPRDDSRKLAELFATCHIDSTVEPLLTIEYVPPGPLGFMPDVIVATSRHALWQKTEIDKPIIVTGEASAAMAKKFGYTRITSLPSARNVPQYIGGHYPKTAKVLYLSGSDITVDIASSLREMGYDARRITTYIAHAAKTFSHEAAQQLRDGMVNAVLFFSARTASTYAALVEQSGLVKQQSSVEAFCLSPEIAEAASRLPFRHVHVAEKTDTQTLVDAVISRYA